MLEVAFIALFDPMQEVISRCQLFLRRKCNHCVRAQPRPIFRGFFEAPLDHIRELLTKSSRDVYLQPNHCKTDVGVALIAVPEPTVQNGMVVRAIYLTDVLSELNIVHISMELSPAEETALYVIRERVDAVSADVPLVELGGGELVLVINLIQPLVAPSLTLNFSVLPLSLPDCLK